MKTTYSLLALTAALALAAGCDDSKRSRYGSDEESIAPEIKREARDGLNAPKNPAESRDTVNVPPPVVKKEIVPGQDIPPRIAENKDVPPAITPEAKRDIKETVDEAKSLAANDRDLFVETMGKKLGEVDVGITELSERIESLKTDTYAKDTLNSLREKRDEVNRKFDELKAASREGWQEFRPGFEAVLDDLTRAYDEAKARYMD